MGRARRDAAPRRRSHREPEIRDRLRLPVRGRQVAHGGGRRGRGGDRPHPLLLRRDGGERRLRPPDAPGLRAGGDALRAAPARRLCGDRPVQLPGGALGRDDERRAPRRQHRRLQAEPDGRAHRPPHRRRLRRGRPAARRREPRLRRRRGRADARRPPRHRRYRLHRLARRRHGDPAPDGGTDLRPPRHCRDGRQEPGLCDGERPTSTPPPRA